VKVTKYPQSCLIIEQNGKRIGIDPGSFVAEKYGAQDLLPLDAILITHEHPDHANPELIRALAQSGEVPVIANQSTKHVLGDLVTQVVMDSEEFEVAGVKIVARELPHCLLPDGTAGPQNTGYVIDGTFFDPGDGIALEGLHVDAAAIPIAGPDVSSKDVFDFVRQLGCRTVIPIHYNYFLEDPRLIARLAPDVVPGVKFVVLDDGQSTEL
jgi:L-ascorbate metabolism protein UlaG (beta-lactamase superfamily)